MRLLLAEDEKDLSKAFCTLLKYNNFAVDAVFFFRLRDSNQYEGRTVAQL